MMNSIFISTTEIMNQSHGSTDLINILLFWHNTSDRVRTYSSRYMTSILNSRRECRQIFFSIRRDTSWSRVIYEWRYPSVVSTFLRLSLSLSLKNISSSEGSVWRQFDRTFPLLSCPLLCRLYICPVSFHPYHSKSRWRRWRYSPLMKLALWSGTRWSADINSTSLLYPCQ